MLVVVCLLVAAANVAYAPAIGGSVRDAQGGEALARVKVQLIGTGLETVTSSDGAFRFDAVPRGQYSLHVETVGYRLIQRVIEMADEDLQFDLVPSPDTFRRTDSVEVRPVCLIPLR